MGEVVQEAVQGEVMAAPAAREVDGLKDRPGRCLEEPVYSNVLHLLLDFLT